MGYVPAFAGDRAPLTGSPLRNGGEGPLRSRSAFPRDETCPLESSRRNFGVRPFSRKTGNRFLKRRNGRPSSSNFVPTGETISDIPWWTGHWKIKVRPSGFGPLLRKQSDSCRFRPGEFQRPEPLLWLVSCLSNSHSLPIEANSRGPGEGRPRRRFGGFFRFMAFGRSGSSGVGSR